MTARRELVGTLLLLLAGGVLGVVSASRPWGSARLASALSPTTIEVTGNDLVPLATALSLVAMAAVLVVPAARRWGRRVVGAILALAGAGLVVACFTVIASLQRRVVGWVADDPSGATASVDQVSTTALWPWACAVAGLVMALAGVVVLARGPSWAGLGSKYERRTTTTQATTPPADSEAERVTDRETWDAIDRGEDPTA